MSRFFFSILCLLFVMQMGTAQPINLIKAKPHILKIDPYSGDTTSIFLKRYTITSKEGILLVEGQMKAERTSCEPRRNGAWIERYRDGKLKATGSYKENKKIGTWTYFHKNGQVSKIENWKAPYDEYLEVTGQYNKHFSLKTNPILAGPYLEYYENGQVKTDGIYTIYEEYSSIDSIEIFDPETYVPTIHYVAGNFWHPVSKKTGIWSTFAKDGALLSSYRFQAYSPPNDIKWRKISARYWDYYKELLETTKKE